MKIGWWKYFALGSFIAGWIMRAIEDGMISRAEVTDLITGVMDMLGIENIPIID